MNETDGGTELDGAFHRRWYVYLACPLLFMALIGFVVFFASFRIDEAVPLYILFVFVFLALAVWALVGYYYDARVLRNADHSWVPRWYLWTAGHMLVSPLIIAPIYLIRRTKKTGVPPRVASLLDN